MGRRDPPGRLDAVQLGHPHIDQGDVDVELGVVPLPAHEVISGLQIELLRGIFAAALGVLLARSTTEVADSPEVIYLDIKI